MKSNHEVSPDPVTLNSSYSKEKSLVESRKKTKEMNSFTKNKQIKNKPKQSLFSRTVLFPQERTLSLLNLNQLMKQTPQKAFGFILDIILDSEKTLY